MIFQVKWRLFHPVKKKRSIAAKRVMGFPCQTYILDCLQGWACKRTDLEIARESQIVSSSVLRFFARRCPEIVDNDNDSGKFPEKMFEKENLASIGFLLCDLT